MSLLLKCATAVAFPTFTTPHRSSWMLSVHSWMQSHSSTYDKEPFWPYFAWELGTQTSQLTRDHAEHLCQSWDEKLGLQSCDQVPLTQGFCTHTPELHLLKRLFPFIMRWLCWGKIPSAFLFTVSTALHSRINVYGYKPPNIYWALKQYLASTEKNHTKKARDWRTWRNRQWKWTETSWQHIPS